MSVDLEHRVAALEGKVANLQQRQKSNAPAKQAWLDDLYGKFAGDSIFEQAMKLGRKYRKSQQPIMRKSKSKK